MLHPARRCLLAVVVLGVVVSGCATGPDVADPPELRPSGPFAVDTVRLEGPDGQEVTVPVWVAAEPDARQRGLMFRESLPEGTGMVFLFPTERTGGFWMKNTLIPLSIAFFDADGTVRAVLDMEPCTADPCPSYDPDVAYLGALEVEQGYFDTIGLTAGWRIVAPDGHEVSRR